MKKKGVTRIGVSLPPELLDRFDEMIDRMGYANRSEAIRDAVREYMIKNEMRDEEGRRVGVVSIIYDHHIHGVNDMLIELQHSYFNEIRSSTHIHLDEHNCMEIVIVSGDARRIKEVKDRITSVTGVKYSDMLITTPTDY